MSYSVFIHSLTALRADADPVGKDDTIMKFNANGNNKQIFKRDFGSGESADVGFSSRSHPDFGPIADFRSASIALFDADRFGSDDFMGSYTISAAEGAAGFDGIKTVTLSGSGSRYQLEYHVFDV